jgi:hypothetical protein
MRMSKMAQMLKMTQKDEEQSLEEYCICIIDTSHARCLATVCSFVKAPLAELLVTASPSFSSLKVVGDPIVSRRSESQHGTS